MEKTRLRLINEQPFYALFLNKCKVVYNERVKTAGVRINQRGEIEMCVAPSFFDSLSIPHRVGLLIHEMLHTMMGHIDKKNRETIEGLHGELANWAQDIAINQMMDKHLLPPGAMLHTSFGFDPDLAFEPYYLELLQKAKKQGGKGENGGLKGQTLDNHEFFENEAVGGVDVNKIIADAIESSLQECKDRFPGKEPHQIERLLADLRKASKVDWKAELRKFVGRNLSDHAESTRTRANRRLGLAAAGTRREYIPKVLILCDHSGSVSDELAANLISEMRHILKATDEKTEVAFFDTEIGTKCKLSAFSEVPPRRQNGGTSFQAAFEYARERKPDLLIMLTDAGDNMPEDQPKFPTLWVVGEGFHTAHLRGKVISV